MKKVFLTIAFLTVAFCANAGWFIAGDFSFGFSNGKQELSGLTFKKTSFGINPAFGYVFNGKFGIALALGYGNGIENYYVDNKDVITNSWKISPFFRYIICNFNDRICFYSDLAFRLNSTNSKTKIVDGETRSSKDIFSVEIAPALSYGLTNNLSIFAKFHFLTLGYYHTIEKADDKTISNQFDFGANNQTVISAGLVYIFK